MTEWMGCPAGAKDPEASVLAYGPFVGIPKASVLAYGPTVGIAGRSVGIHSGPGGISGRLAEVNKNSGGVYRSFAEENEPMAELIPRSDLEFDALQTLALAAISADLPGYGLGLGDPLLVAATTAQTDWNIKFPASTTAKAAAQAAVAGKDSSRGVFEPALRALFAKILVNPAVTPAKRQAAGLPLYDTEPTPTPVPTTRPVMILDTSERFRQTVNYADEGTPTSKARPFGVIGCELRVFVGATAPVDPDDYDLAGLITKTPHLEEFDPALAGQMGILELCVRSYPKVPPFV